jgi:hypothetical protein
MSRGRDGDGDGMRRSGAAASAIRSQQQPHRRVEVPASAVTGFEAALGDPTVSLTLAAWRRGGSAVSLSATAKLPLTDTTQFGTGEWDVGGTVSWSQLGGRALLGLDASYWHLGDLPELDLRDP